MTRRIEIEIDGAHASLALMDDVAPQAADALWDALPLELTVSNGTWSGEACYSVVEGGPLGNLPERLELGVTSIYTGHLVVAPLPNKRAELLLSYGQSELRGPTGRTYATPVAEPLEGFAAVAAALRQVKARGSAALSIRRAAD